jgi:predicted transcriptional regulator
MSRPKVLYISDPAMWKVLASPVRFEIVECMRSIAPCSIAEIAQSLSRPADALYRHVEKLQEAGYIVSAGYRKARRHVEQLIDLTAEDFQFDSRPVEGGATAPQMNAALLTTIEAMFKSALRTARDSVASGGIDQSDPKRKLFALYEVCRVSDDDFGEIVRLLREIKRITDGRRLREGGKLIAVSMLATPVTRKSRSRPGSRTDRGIVRNGDDTAVVVVGKGRVDDE